MACILCRKKKTVINLQQGPLCGDCFVKYFQKKVYRTIRQHRLFNKKDVLCVGCSGGKDSIAALYLVSRITKERKQRLFALGVDEGVKGYRDVQLRDMEKLCKEHGIEYHILRFKDFYGKTNEELMALARKMKVDISQCTLCGILRRRLMNRFARENGATKMVVGHNLDDEAQTTLMSLFKGSVELLARLGPAPGAVRHEGFIPRVKPLYFCTDEETELYTRLMGFRVLYRPCPHRKDSFRDYIDRKLKSIEKDYPGTKSAIIQNTLKLVPVLRKEYGRGKIPACAKCGEPSRNRVCKACLTLGKLGII
jgi:uncharacterized protein (TIGR00269 family)